MQHDEIDNIQNGQRLPTLIMCMACFETATINAVGVECKEGSGDILVIVCNDSDFGCMRGLSVSWSGHCLLSIEVNNKTADQPSKSSVSSVYGSCSIGMAQGMWSVGAGAVKPALTP